MTANDLDPLLELYQVERAAGSSFDAGIEQALRLILASPKFLFRVETPPTSAAGVGAGLVTWSLPRASRSSCGARSPTKNC